MPRYNQSLVQDYELIVRLIAENEEQQTVMVKAQQELRYQRQALEQQKRNIEDRLGPAFRREQGVPRAEDLIRRKL